MITLIASNSSTSINREVAKKVNEHLDLNILDINQELIPMYSPQLEAKGIPDEITRIYDAIKAEDKVVIFTPEYNGYTTPYFKNIFDWVSRVEHAFLQDKDVKVVTVTPGAMGGASVRSILETSLPFFGAKSVATYGFGEFFTKVEKGELDTDLEAIVQMIK